jgi:hypothetical protein
MAGRVGEQPKKHVTRSQAHPETPSPIAGWIPPRVPLVKSVNFRQIERNLTHRSRLECETSIVRQVDRLGKSVTRLPAQFQVRVNHRP